jgi:signal transduction histidine kinase
VGDEEQRKRLFRDVDAMQVMIDSTVAFFRDDFEDEEITVHCETRRLYVIVRDRGPGIPADEAERVFSPFYRLERPRNRTTGGGRLALTSARAVIRAHGGDIALRNRPDGGLKVTVTLPSP